MGKSLKLIALWGGIAVGLASLNASAFTIINNDITEVYMMVFTDDGLDLCAAFWLPKGSTGTWTTQGSGFGSCHGSGPEHVEITIFGLTNKAHCTNGPFSIGFNRRLKNHGTVIEVKSIAGTTHCYQKSG